MHISMVAPEERLGLELNAVTQSHRWNGFVARGCPIAPEKRSLKRFIHRRRQVQGSGGCHIERRSTKSEPCDIRQTAIFDITGHDDSEQGLAILAKGKDGIIRMIHRDKLFENDAVAIDFYLQCWRGELKLLAGLCK